MTARAFSAIFVSLLLLASSAGVAVAGAAGPGTAAGDAAAIDGAAGDAPAQTGSNARGSPDIGAYVTNPNVVPGRTNEVAVTIANDGNLRSGTPGEAEAVTTARNVQVDAEAEGPLSVNSETIGIGSVTISTPAEAPVSIDVPENVDAGTYSIDLEITYTYLSSSGNNDRTVTVSRDVDVRVRSDARFRVTNVSSDVQVGDSGTLAVELQNTGQEPATRADIQLTSAAGALTFSGGTSSTARIDELAPSETATVTYDVEVASNSAVRSYAVTGGVTFKDPDGITRTDDTLSFGVVPLDEQEFSVGNVSTDLRVGEDGDLMGTVTNEGPESARNVVVRYTDDSPNVIPIEDAVAVGSLEPGERADFRLPIEVNTEAEPISRVASLSVRYRDDDGERRDYDEVEAVYTVGPERDEFDVEIDDREIEAGSTATVDVTVTNNLDEPVSNVEARLFANAPLSSDDDEAFAASLDPGESTTMTFTISAAGGATLKTYPVSLDFRYDDASGDSQLSDTFRAAVTLTESSGGSSLGPLLGIVAVVGVLVGVGVYFLRRE
mgnify:CR=1 FL=1